MNRPTITCEIAFTTDPAATPVWTDVSAYVLSFQTRRGRNMELDRMTAGTASVELNNHDRRFEPGRAASPYYPNVLPMRRLRLRATWNTVTYDLFHGFVEQWPQTYEGWGNDGRVQVTAVDAFEILTNAVFASVGARTTERSDLRVAYVLDQIGWPAADRSLSVGQSTIQAYDFDSYNALQHLQEVGETENGVVFVDGTGRVVFHDRHRRFKSPYSTVAASFGDASGENPYAGMVLNFSKDQIRNDVNGVRANDAAAVPVNERDTSSVVSYLQRSYPSGGAKALWVTSDLEVADWTRYTLSRYKEPSLRIDSFTVESQTDATVLWPLVLGREIGDKINVKRRPDGGTAISQDSHVEAVSHADDGTRFSTTFGLSPADPQTYWAAGQAGYSEAGMTTKVAY